MYSINLLHHPGEAWKNEISGVSLNLLFLSCRARKRIASLINIMSSCHCIKIHSFSSPLNSEKDATSPWWTSPWWACFMLRIFQDFFFFCLCQSLILLFYTLNSLIAALLLCSSANSMTCNLNTASKDERLRFSFSV